MRDSKVRIRYATPEDVDAVCAVLRKAFAGLRGRGYSERALRAAMLPPQCLRERLTRGAHLLVAELEGRIVGTATGIEEHESLHVCSVAVDPAFQGGGVARRLMERLEAIACERGCHKLFLQTAWAMTEAIRLYRSLGYEQEGYQRAHFYGEDFLMFAKLLGGAGEGAKRLEIRGLDVFTDRPFMGNPTTVVLNADELSPEEMQAVARELNLETTFVLKPTTDRAMFKLCYFMPLCEIELCGHGTIGAVWALAEEGTIPRGLSELAVETPVGLLRVELEWEEGGLKRVMMDQLPPKFANPCCSVEEVVQALGITPDSIADTGLPITGASTGRAKLLIPLSDWQALDSTAPNGELLEELCRRAGVTGLYPFTLKPRSSGVTAEARQFPSGGGVIEDPVTGVAACALGAYLVHQRAVEVKEPVTRLLIEQGHAIRRPGRVEVRIQLNRGKIVKTQIAGQAVPIFRSGMRLWT